MHVSLSWACIKTLRLAPSCLVSNIWAAQMCLSYDSSHNLFPTWAFIKQLHAFVLPICLI